MNKVNEKRYNEIKKLAINCIEDFFKNKDNLRTIETYLKKHGASLSSNEEIILFKTMVLFPDSKKFLNTYNDDKNINKLSQKYGISKETINSKLNSISFYEFLYEKPTKLLKISNIDVLKINSDIKNANNSINRTIQTFMKFKKH